MRERWLKSTRDGIIPTVRLGLDKIKTKRYSTYKPFTYTTLLRLCKTKKVFIREKAYTAFRV